MSLPPREIARAVTWGSGRVASVSAFSPGPMRRTRPPSPVPMYSRSLSRAEHQTIGWACSAFREEERGSSRGARAMLPCAPRLTPSGRPCASSAGAVPRQKTVSTARVGANVAVNAATQQRPRIWPRRVTVRPRGRAAGIRRSRRRSRLPSRRPAGREEAGSCLVASGR